MASARPGPGGVSGGQATPFGVRSASATPVRTPVASDDTLHSYLEQVAGGRVGQRALVFRLSRLHRSHRRDKHLQIVANMLQDVTRQYLGRLFALRNGDMVLVCKGITRKAIDETTELLRYLFNDDPLAREGAEQADLCITFDLEVGYPQFLAALDEIREAEAKRRAAARAAAEAGTPGGETGALDPGRASALINAVSRLDLSSMVRRQTVWHMPADEPAQARFDELFISIDRLRQAIGPNFDLAKDRLLFQYLMRWLDRYMLSTLLPHHAGLLRPLSVNINLATLLSPEFAAFDNGRPTDWRDRLILEMQMADLWSDLPAFLSVAEAVKRRRYQRCLDGVLYQALPFVNFRRFDFEYVKVIWDDSLLQLDEGALRELCAAIAECGADRIILARCGRREAIKVGQAMGIQLFQGWQVDQANQPS